MTDHPKHAILNESRRYSEQDSFRFRCGKDLPCFNQCCRDVNIALTPYDLLRMRRALAIGSKEFLDQYCVLPFRKEQRFPVVLLRMNDDSERTCPFVTESGCSIYQDRPWACRMYPVGEASPSDSSEQEFFFIVDEDVCKGHQIDREWTIEEWLKDQEVTPYNALGDEFKKLLLDEAFREKRELAPQQINMLFMTLYDLDQFRRFILESSFLKRFKVKRQLVDRIRSDDEELLRFGFRWLRFSLLGEPLFKIRSGAKKKARARSR